MIKYQYAYGSDGRVVSVLAVVRTPGLSQNFTCISCGRELIAKLGSVRAKHFAHKEQVSCNSETYLHALGKKMFYEEYLYCLENKSPFYIELSQDKTCVRYKSTLGHTCNLGSVVSKFDLTEHFTDIKMETKEGGFIPDVMLVTKNGKNKLFIEIAVTHYSTEEKLSSGYRIIELEVENEGDLEVIKNHLLSVNHSKVLFKNFNKPKDKIYCEKACNRTFDLFVVKKDGRSRLFQKSLSDIFQFLKRESSNLTYKNISKDYGSRYAQKFKASIGMAYQSGVGVRNCFLCRYGAQYVSFHFDEEDQNPIFCKFLKQRCNSNKAVECKYYIPEKEHAEELIRNNGYILKLSEKDANDKYYDFEEAWLK